MRKLVLGSSVQSTWVKTVSNRCCVTFMKVLPFDRLKVPMKQELTPLMSRMRLSWPTSLSDEFCGPTTRTKISTLCPASCWTTAVPSVVRSQSTMSNVLTPDRGRSGTGSASAALPGSPALGVCDRLRDLTADLTRGVLRRVHVDVVPAGEQILDLVGRQRHRTPCHRRRARRTAQRDHDRARHLAPAHVDVRRGRGPREMPEREPPRQRRSLQCCRESARGTQLRPFRDGLLLADVERGLELERRGRRLGPDGHGGRDERADRRREHERYELGAHAYSSSEIAVTPRRSHRRRFPTQNAG